MRLVVFCNLKRILSRCLQVRKLLTANLQKFSEILIPVFVILFCHDKPPKYR